jgi:crotonobetainyl-CoA:carnitine CoA-transferase CaiB-like acyl-CoA transferase
VARIAVPRTRREVIMDGALDGIRVVEMGELIAAPFCARLFADYGADVIKVEPGTGDRARTWGPFPGDVTDAEKSGLYFFLNTNKRAVTLDADHDDGRAALHRLLRDADVFIHGMRPSLLAARGLDFDTLSRINPRLVMISVTPFGQTGPYAEWKAYDLNAFHLTAAGSRYLGRPGEPPLEPGTFIADFFGGYAGAAWGLAAVYGADAVGGGQHIDVSTAEVIAALFTGAQNIGGYAQDGVFEKRSGVGMRLGAPATIFPCKDGYVWMLALEPGQWKGLARAMGDPDWMQLEQFLDMYNRAQNVDAMNPLIREWTMEHTKQEIMDLCQANGCPTTAIYTVDEVANHPHLAERSFIATLEHPALGPMRAIGPPLRLTGSPGGPRRAAPMLGAHNDEVLGALARGDDVWRLTQPEAV